MKVAAILPAAGLGTRMGRTSAEKAGTSRKQFMLLDGAPILVHAVRKFAAAPRVDEIVVAVRRDDLDWVTELMQREVRGKRVRVVEGGNSRQQSVENALAALDPDTTLVAVHDAVRPFIDLETIDKVIDEAAETGAAIVGIVPVDTVKQVARAQTNKAKIRATLPREKAGAGANPASLPLRSAGAGLRRRAKRRIHRHRRIQPGGAAGSGSQRGAGQRPQHQDHQAQRYGLGAPVPGRGNRAPRTVSEYRTGLGWDVHRLARHRLLILGGVTIPSEFGLEGHSDADVLAHAITDAILGAAALGDIGMHFPDTDPRWKGAGSLTVPGPCPRSGARPRLPYRECGFHRDPGAAQAQGLS